MLETENEKVIVIHGFNSGPGEKAVFVDEWLKLNCQNRRYEVISPKLSISPKIAFNQLSEFLELNINEKITVIGTSLGGFYTLCLKSKFDSSNFSFHAINPAWLPSKNMNHYVGMEQINFKTNEKWIFSEQYLEEVKELEQFAFENLKECKDPIFTLHLAYEDEVLNFEEFLNYIQTYKAKFKKVKKYYYHTNHRFEKMEELVQNVFYS